jgi:hypothetical protein
VHTLLEQCPFPPSTSSGPINGLPIQANQGNARLVAVLPSKHTADTAAMRVEVVNGTFVVEERMRAHRKIVAVGWRRLISWLVHNLVLWLRLLPLVAVSMHPLQHVGKGESRPHLSFFSRFVPISDIDGVSKGY